MIENTCELSNHGAAVRTGRIAMWKAHLQARRRECGSVGWNEGETTVK